MKEDVQRAIDTGVNGVVMEIPSSKHMVDLAYRWPMEKAIETSIEATAFAHKNGLEVVFFPIDFSRAELKWALDLIERVGKDGHMDALALVDTFGVLSPHAMKYFVTEVQKRIKKRLEAHFHQDFGMGVANTIMALSLGVEVMHTTVLGIGERSGNAPMEEIVMALKTMYGVDVGIDTTKLTSLANLVQRLTGVVVPTNKAIVGSGLYQIEVRHHRVVVQELRREERHRAVPDPLERGRPAAGGSGDGQGLGYRLGQHVAEGRRHAGVGRGRHEGVAGGQAAFADQQEDALARGIPRSGSGHSGPDAAGGGVSLARTTNAEAPGNNPGAFFVFSSPRGTLRPPCKGCEECVATAVPRNDECHILNGTTFWRCWPSPAIPSVTTSPALR